MALMPVFRRIYVVVMERKNIRKTGRLNTTIFPKLPNLRQILTSGQHSRQWHETMEPTKIENLWNPCFEAPFMITCNFTCKTKNYIYTFSCKYCLFFYIDKCTTSLNIRGKQSSKLLNRSLTLLFLSLQIVIPITPP